MATNTIPRDDNQVPFQNIDSFGVVTTAPSAFVGGTANAHGDSGGTGNPLTLFTVTGDVLVRIFGVCTTLLTSAGGGTLEVGVAGNTAALIALTTATEIDANEIWSDTTPTLGVDTLASVLGPYIIVNSLNIIETTATADITAGAVRYVCLWRPLSRDGLVVAA